MFILTLAAATQSGTSSKKGKPQKRKLPACGSKEDADSMDKSTKRRKNVVPNEEGSLQNRFVNLFGYVCYYSDCH